jgi:hypothetical protein
VSVSISTSTSFPASKAEEKARKKELKAQYKAVKQDAKAREKEAHRQADEIRRELKHQAMELKREISHQAKMAQHAPSPAPGPSRSPMINPISQLGQLAMQQELAQQERRLAHDLYKTQKHQVRQERKEQRRMDREIRREHRHGHVVPVGPAIAVAPAVSVVSVPPIVAPGTFVAPVTHATPPQPYYPQQQWPLPQEQPQYRQDVVAPEKPLPNIKGEKDIGVQDPLLVYSMSSLSLRPSSSSPCSIPTPSAPPLRDLVVSGPQGQEDETPSGAPPPPYEPVDSTHSPSIPQKIPL